MTFADFKDVVTLAGPFLGFLAGWGLFELTERRKVRMAERTLRVALVAELQHTELLLSSILGRYAYLAQSPAEIQRAASEIRRFLAVGRERRQAIGFGELPEPPAGFDSLSDEQVVTGFGGRPQSARMGTKVIFPVIDSVLAGRTSGFTSAQIQALSSVRSQAVLLEQNAGWMAEFLHLTFTVTDEGNHEIVTANFDTQTRGYAQRANILLRCVRTALGALG